MRLAVVLLASLACVSLGDVQRDRRLQALESVLLAMSPATQSSRRQTSRRLSPQMMDRRQVTNAGAAAALAGWLSLALPDAAEAARTGGRAGGRVPTRSRAAPRGGSSYAPRTTNVYVAPTVGVAPMSPFGYGYGGYGYGYGYGGGISTGAFLGIELVETFIREQRRQEYLQQQLRVQQELGRDQAQIAQLQNELAQQNAKIAGMQKDNPDLQKQSMAQLQQQLEAQKKEIEQLKAR